MSNQAPKKARYEIKFVAYETEYHTILRWLKVHSAGFYAPFPDRWVNNVYFDTYGCLAYSENLSGASSRTKIRYRWYGKSVWPEKGVLEIKCKRNYFGWKQKFPVNDQPGQVGNTWHELKQFIISQISTDGRKWLEANPQPIILNRYHRKYFVSLDEKVRVTIDDEQSVWDQRLKSSPNFIRKAHLPKSLVVEFKFDREDKEYANDILQGFPIRVSRHSKYMNGLQAIMRG